MSKHNAETTIEMAKAKYSNPRLGSTGSSAAGGFSAVQVTIRPPQGGEDLQGHHPGGIRECGCYRARPRFALSARSGQPPGQPRSGLFSGWKGPSPLGCLRRVAGGNSALTQETSWMQHPPKDDEGVQRWCVSLKLRAAPNPLIVCCSGTFR